MVLLGCQFLVQQWSPFTVLLWVVDWWVALGFAAKKYKMVQRITQYHRAWFLCLALRRIAVGVIGLPHSNSAGSLVLNAPAIVCFAW